MTISTKALTAALLLSLTPALALAQTPLTGPGFIGAPTTHGPFDGGANPNYGGTPVQVADCGASYAQFLVGQNVNYVPLPGNIRVIGPDTLVTFDYRTDRMNVAHDQIGTITRVYCG